MKRFQVSLRDVFILVTVLCVQLALFALFFQLSENMLQWVLVTGLQAISLIAIPLLLAVVVSDIRGHLPLLSAILGFVSVEVLYKLALTHDPVSLVIYFLLGDSDLEGSLHSLTLWSISLLLSLVSAWVTRSLMPRSSTPPTGPAPS